MNLNRHCIFILLVGLIWILDSTTPVSADLTSVGCSLGAVLGSRTVVINSPGLSKEYFHSWTMFIDVETNTGGLNTFTESITNNTSEDWTDFHWGFMKEIGNVTVVDVSGIQPFATINTTSTVTPLLVLNVGESDGRIFRLTQFSTITVPVLSTVLEPSTYLHVCRRHAGCHCHRLPTTKEG